MYNLGLLYKNHFKNYEKAEEYYLKTIQINPKHDKAIHNLELL